MADQKTLAFYSENAETIFERYESAQSQWQKHFALSFPAGARVLDVGAGSSRDLRALLAQGYDAYGVELCEALRSKALKHHSDLSPRLFAGALPQLDTNEKYDGILCSAVFMHIPESEQVQALINLRELLRPGGRLLISIPTQRSDVGSDKRDKAGRLFNLVAPGSEIQCFMDSAIVMSL